jgi:hypothetical protein
MNFSCFAIPIIKNRSALLPSFENADTPDTRVSCSGVCRRVMWGLRARFVGRHYDKSTRQMLSLAHDALTTMRAPERAFSRSRCGKLDTTRRRDATR